MKTCFTLAVFVFLHLILPAQDKGQDDMQLLRAYFQQQDNSSLPKAQKKIHPKKPVRFSETAALLPLWIYQKVFSEQISAACEFDRSCSNFAISAIASLGVLKGILVTADRLTRCNGQSQLETENYLINHTNGKTIDEPWMYRFKD